MNVYMDCLKENREDVPVEVLKEVKESEKKAAKKSGRVQKEPWDKNDTPAEPASVAERFFSRLCGLNSL